MVENIEIKDHAKNLVCALQALAPSRNIFVQFLAMLSLDYTELYDTFPELLKDKETRRAIEKVFGISFGEKVQLNYNKSLGRPIIDFYEGVFNALNQDEVREGLALLCGIPNEKIPNPRREWISIRLEGLALEPNFGKESLLVLKEIKNAAEEGNLNYPEYKLSLPKIEELTRIEERRILSIADILLKYKLIDKTSVKEEDENGNYVQKDAIEFKPDLQENIDLIPL